MCPKINIKMFSTQKSVSTIFPIIYLTIQFKVPCVCSLQCMLALPYNIAKIIQPTLTFTAYNIHNIITICMSMYIFFIQI